MIKHSHTCSLVEQRHGTERHFVLTTFLLHFHSQLGSKWNEMSQMMEKSTESPSEDRASFKSNGSIKSDEKLSTDGGTKLGRLRSFRKSIQHATQKSPLSSVKGSKVTSKSDTPTNESDSAASPPPPSPSEYPHGCNKICCEAGFADRWNLKVKRRAKRILQIIYTSLSLLKRSSHKT